MSEPFAAHGPLNAATNRMKGKVCLVTGGGSGIGRAAAIRMAEEGAAAVVIAGRREAEIESAAAECRTLGAQALAIRTDVTREEDVERLVRATVERYGGLDAAFNNAGFQERRAPLEQQGSAVYDDVFDANVRSIFLCLRHQLPVMFARGRGQDCRQCVGQRYPESERRPVALLRLQGGGDFADAVSRDGGRTSRREDQRGRTGPCRHRHDAALGGR